jgi:hypothetical protein
MIRFAIRLAFTLILAFQVGSFGNAHDAAHDHVGTDSRLHDTAPEELARLAASLASALYPNVDQRRLRMLTGDDAVRTHMLIPEPPPPRSA